MTFIEQPPDDQQLDQSSPTERFAAVLSARITLLLHGEQLYVRAAARARFATMLAHRLDGGCGYYLDNIYALRSCFCSGE